MCFYLSLFLLYINIEIGKIDVKTLWEIAVHLTVAGDVFDGVFLCCPFPIKCLR